MGSMTSQELKAYAKAGAIAQEVFSSIRTVFSYNGAAYESRRFDSTFSHGICNIILLFQV